MFYAIVRFDGLGLNDDASVASLVILALRRHRTRNITARHYHTCQNDCHKYKSFHS